METTIEYVERVAPDDVRATLRWLVDEGFSLTRSQGNSNEHMGSAILVFSREREVTVLRDRSQWDISVALAPGGDALSLGVLDAARRGVEWEPGPRRPVGAPLACQLPEGLPWAETLPLVVAWLDKPGAEAAVTVASANARERMRRWWKEAPTAEA